MNKSMIISASTVAMAASSAATALAAETLLMPEIRLSLQRC